MTILLAVAVALPALLGGYGGDITICFGGGHDHAAHQAEDACQLACTHDSDWPVPVPVDEHDEHCDCTDLTLAVVDVPATHRAQVVSLPALMVVPAVLLSADGATFNPYRTGPPGLLRDDPGGAFRLAIVRSTRLII